MNSRRMSVLAHVAVASFLMTLVIPSLSQADLTIESYCQVAVALAQQKVDYLTKLDPLTQTYTEVYAKFQQYVSNAQTYLDQRKLLQTPFNQAKAAIFAASDTTEAEHLAFQSENEAAIKAYLGTVPDLKAALDSLSGQIGQLKEELLIPDYCLLSIANAQYQIAETAERYQAAQALADNVKALLDMEKAKREQFDLKITALYALFDTTAKDYVTFKNRHNIVLGKYLNAHPVVKAAIDELSAQVRAGLKAYDELRDTIIVPGEIEEPKR